MSAILLDDGVVHYEVIGRGRPIIFIHGWVGSWRYWVPAMQATSKNYRSYAMDMWGFGETTRNLDLYSINKQVGLLDQFLQKLGIGKVAIVGHGLGALVGLLFTMRYPTVVDRIMGVELPLEAGAIQNRLRSASLVELTDWLLLKDAAAEPARTDGLKADPLALAASFDTPDVYELSQKMNSLKTPCLLVYGQKDPAVAAPNFEKLAMAYYTHIMVFEESGHFPMLDDPAGFNRLLIDFLALESSDTPRDLQMKEEWKRRVR